MKTSEWLPADMIMAWHAKHPHHPSFIIIDTCATVFLLFLLHLLALLKRFFSPLTWVTAPSALFEPFSP